MKNEKYLLFLILINIIFCFQQAPRGCAIIICANKVDLPPEEWKISREEYLAFALKNNFLLVEASASTGQKVHEIFEELTRQILTKNRDDLAKINVTEDNVNLFNIKKEKRPKPCGGCSVM